MAGLRFWSVCSHTDIVLGDVKLAIDRPGVFRYYFETIDADVGRVKEEVRLHTESYMLELKEEGAAAFLTWACR